MYLPRNLLYTLDHLWLRQAGRMDAYIGITAFVQGELKLITSLKFITGSYFEKGEVFGNIHGTNNFDLIMPFAGKILLLNAELTKRKNLMLNIDPYDSWIALVSIKDSESAPEFLTAKAYKAFIDQLSTISN